MASKNAAPPTVSHVTFLRDKFMLQHDGDNYILLTHCTCRGRPDYVDTRREWMATGATGRTVDVIRRQIRQLHPIPFNDILIDAMDEALAGVTLAIPPSPTKRAVEPEPAAE